MKNKLRKIVVEKETYLWRRQHFHINKNEEDVCVEKIRIYLNGYKKSMLDIYFKNEDTTTWKVDKSEGLLLKYTIKEKETIVESINLNKPSTIEKLIRYFKKIVGNLKKIVP